MFNCVYIHIRYKHFFKDTQHNLSHNIKRTNPPLMSDGNTKMKPTKTNRSSTDSECVKKKERKHFVKSQRRERHDAFFYKSQGSSYFVKLASVNAVNFAFKSHELTSGKVGDRSKSLKKDNRLQRMGYISNQGRTDLHRANVPEYFVMVTHNMNTLPRT